MIILSPTLKSSLTQFVCFCIIYNRPAANQSLGFSPCPHPSLMMKTWPGLTPGPPPPGIASLKVSQSPSQVPFSLIMFLRNLLTKQCRWTASVLPSYSVLMISGRQLRRFLGRSCRRADINLLFAVLKNPPPGQAWITLICEDSLTPCVWTPVLHQAFTFTNLVAHH